ncbi:MAG: reverse transcriptase family protein [Candidatus Sulcia muelleri]|nr:reverse transcriptase family protein [Candidatus Karelsulcia muelleri]
MCIKQGIYPDKLKVSKVIPIHKRGPRDDCANYRPISIVPTLSKVLERLIHEQLSSFLESNKLLSKNQYGFRPNHSTVEATQDLILNCFEGLENNLNVLFRSFDMSKAFDTVSHHILLDKMYFYSIDNSVVQFLRSYLNNRWQSVFLNGSYSKQLSVKQGVPQGSILGPLLFILYVNDLPYNLNAHSVKSFLFADDLAVCVQGNSAENVGYIIDAKTKTIHDWCNANKLSLNDGKTQDLAFSLSNRGEVTHSKFLGFTVQSNLKWHQQIDSLANKISKGIFMIRALKGSVSVGVLLCVYYGHIHSYLSYGTSIWANHGYVQKLFVLQKKQSV